MIAGMTYYEIASYFIIYSFLGWCIEVIYHAVKIGKVINRGFLNGPVCPVYGFGILAVFAFTKAVLPTFTALSESRMTGENRLTDLLILFLLGMALTTSIELAAGWLLDVCFHARWWDYSSQPLNFHGYICLRFSIIWGLAVIFVVKVVQPAMEADTTWHLSSKCGWPLLAVCYLLYLADFIVTVMIVAGLNRRLGELDEIRKRMRVVSNALSEKIGGDTLEAQQRVDEGRLQAHLAGMELKGELQERSEENAERLHRRKQTLEAEIMAHPYFGSRRLLNAFPEMRHREHDSLLRKLLNAGDPASPSSDTAEEN